MPPDDSNREARRRPAVRAFTIIELLVVMAVIGILAASLLVAGTAVIDATKTRNTRAVLVMVRDALEEFKEEQTDNQTLTRPAGYRARYDLYPPDELEVFSSAGVPYAVPPTGTRGIGGAVVVPGPGAGGYDAMLFHTDGLAETDAAVEHRDLAAMILAIDMFGESADMMLEGIPSSYRSSGPLRTDGTPAQYLDRPPLGSGMNPTFESMEDQQIRYIVDAWGVPITYLAQRDYDGNDKDATLSTNHAEWNWASTEMIQLNAGRPILFSYGPDGPEQLRKEVVVPQGGAATATATLIQDWADDRKINNPLNDDNVYPDEALKEKLRRGAPSSH